MNLLLLTMILPLDGSNEDYDHHEQHYDLMLMTMMAMKLIIILLPLDGSNEDDDDHHEQEYDNVDDHGGDEYHNPLASQWE